VAEPPSKVSQYQSLIEKELAVLKLPEEPKKLYEPIRYTLSLGGKRMRPVLLLLGCDLFDGNIEKAISAALAVELFHNFTLMHDDIMDNAPLRRNQPTTHQKWNKNVAILSGDLMLVKAYELLNSCETENLSGILNVFNEAATKVCEGQQMDMDFEEKETIFIDEYIKMISLKTAALLAGSLKIGAILGGASADDSRKLQEFGKHIGIAFQLQDDLLDVFGNPEKFGKTVGGDIIANKKTFLFLKAFELADALQKRTLQNLLVDEGHPDLIGGQTSSGCLSQPVRQNPQLVRKKSVREKAKEKIERVTDLYCQLNVKEITKKEIERYYIKGMQFLNETSTSSEKKSEITSFVSQLMIREL